CAVVREVLLGGAAGERHRDPLDGAAAAEDARDETRYPCEARPAGLLRVEPAAEEAARLEEEAGERARVWPGRGEPGERAEACAQPRRAAVVGPERGQPVGDERPRVP